MGRKNRRKVLSKNNLSLYGKPIKTEQIRGYCKLHKCYLIHRNIYERKCVKGNIPCIHFIQFHKNHILDYYGVVENQNYTNTQISNCSKP